MEKNYQALQNQLKMKKDDECNILWTEQFSILNQSYGRAYEPLWRKCLIKTTIWDLWFVASSFWRIYWFSDAQSKIEITIARLFCFLWLQIFLHSLNKHHPSKFLKWSGGVIWIQIHKEVNSDSIQFIETICYASNHIS